MARNSVAPAPPNSAQEAYELYFERLRPNQRRFLLARMEADTDAEAYRRVHISPHTLYDWRHNSVPFETVYTEVIRAAPDELAALQVYRLQEVAASCITTIEDALSATPDPDDISTGVFDAKLRKGALALNMLKETRARTPQALKRKRVADQTVEDDRVPPSPDAIARLTMGNRSPA